ncbi:hypothetical protein ILYODFUR_038064 [Ilyodon furcidens]|uniref:Uncharacterized protein n=1 Tax=Ilyodon furcidens TaxID=33524 RepID=A0ABV0TQN0_9TELE
MWRSSSSTPSFSQMAKLLTLSLGECPATLRRKLTSATCIQYLRSFGHHPKFMAIGEGRNVDRPVNREFHFSAQLTLHHKRLAERPRYCGSHTDPSVDLPLHSPFTREQDPKILELLQLRQELPSNLKRASHPFPVKNHALGLEGTDLHPSRFSLCCGLPQCMLLVLAREGQQDHVICKKKKQNQLVPKPDSLRPLAAPKNPVHKSYEQDL